MKNIDPLMILTVLVGLGLLMVLGRFAVTGDLPTELLTVMGTMIGGLVTALSTRKKDKDGDGNGD